MFLLPNISFFSHFTASIPRIFIRRINRRQKKEWKNSVKDYNLSFNCFSIKWNSLLKYYCKIKSTKLNKKLFTVKPIKHIVLFIQAPIFWHLKSKKKEINEQNKKNLPDQGVNHSLWSLDLPTKISENAFKQNANEQKLYYTWAVGTDWVIILLSIRWNIILVIFFIVIKSGFKIGRLENNNKMFIIIKRKKNSMQKKKQINNKNPYRIV